MKKAIIAMSLAALMVTGCARQVHYVNGTSTGGTEVNKTNQTFFISGLGQTKTVNAASVCGSAGNVMAVETISSPLNIILGIVTFGIYTPREQTVYCR